MYLSLQSTYIACPMRNNNIERKLEPTNNVVKEEI